MWPVPEITQHRVDTSTSTRTRTCRAEVSAIAALVLMSCLLAASPTLASQPLDEAPGEILTPAAVPFRPSVLSTSRLDFTISKVVEVKFDRGLRSATVNVTGNTVTVFTDRHPGVLWIVVRGDGEIRADTWHRTSGYVIIWEALTHPKSPLPLNQHASGRFELTPADTSRGYTIYILAASDIAASGSLGLTLQAH